MQSFFDLDGRKCPDHYPCVYLKGKLCCKFNLTYYNYPIDIEKLSCKDKAKVPCRFSSCDDSGISFIWATRLANLLDKSNCSSHISCNFDIKISFYRSLCTYWWSHKICSKIFYNIAIRSKEFKLRRWIDNAEASFNDLNNISIIIPNLHIQLQIDYYSVALIIRIVLYLCLPKHLFI